MTTENHTQTNPETELMIIRKIMEDSRNIIIDNGIHYIFWGVLVTSALILNYIIIIFRFYPEYIGLMWFILMVSGAIADGLIERRNEKKRKVNTFAGKLLGTLWSASGLCMFIFGFIGVITGSYSPFIISPIISVVLGAAYFISGAIQQVKWIQALLAGWWGGALYMFMFPGRETLLIFAVMVITFQVVPGIVLYRKWKKAGVSFND